MAASNSIKCDNCGAERIIDSMSPAVFTLELRAINTGVNTSGRQHMVSVHNKYETPHHFCDEKCLAEYLAK